MSSSPAARRGYQRSDLCWAVVQSTFPVCASALQGVLLTHQNVLAYTRWHVPYYQLTHEEGVRSHEFYARCRALPLAALKGPRSSRRRAVLRCLLGGARGTLSRPRVLMPQRTARTAPWCEEIWPTLSVGGMAAQTSAIMIPQCLFFYLNDGATRTARSFARLRASCSRRQLASASRGWHADLSKK